MDTEINMLKREVMALRIVVNSMVAAFPTQGEELRAAIDEQIKALLDDPHWEADAKTIGRTAMGLIR